MDKRMTEEEVVAELSDGMTIGIGGWGSRRKPMSIVRAIAQSTLRDPTIVSYGGPDIGLLCSAGNVSRVIYPFCSLDSSQKCCAIIAIAPLVKVVRSGFRLFATLALFTAPARATPRRRAERAPGRLLEEPTTLLLEPARR